MTPAVALLLCACTGSIGDGDSETEGPGGEVCAAAGIQRTPLRRLTRAEYRATVRDLLSIAPPALEEFVDDEVRAGFDLNVTAASALTVETYRTAAVELAAETRAQFEQMISCDWSTSECVSGFVSDFGLRAFRRPLRTDELADLMALWEAESDASDVTTALELVVQTMLMSPHFVYHVELGKEGGAAGEVPLTSYEVASRLSYFLWGTMPDAALFAAAANGDLEERDGIEREARRMLEDPKAREMLVEFQREWLDLRHIEGVTRDIETFPDWTPDLLVAMQAETATFFEQVFFEGDARLETLLSAPYSYVDGDLAEHYGASAPDESGKASFPAGERAGILTQGLFLVTRSLPSENSWVHRGKFVRERLLCGSMPPPPPEADLTGGNDPNRLTNAECSGCHMLMDPIGKAFDRYSPTGEYSATDALGNVIPADGAAHNSDVGEFGSVIELANQLADSRDVQACMAKTFATFALARDLELDPCAQAEVIAAFDASGHDMRELFVAITLSDAFRYTNAD
jgi:hypothetical protein